MKFSPLPLIASLALAGCQTSTEFVTHKVAVGGLYVGPGAFGAGYVAASGTNVPFLTKDGKTLFLVQDDCGGQNAPAIYSNLNTNASAQANVTNASGAVPVASAASSTGDVTATGDAAKNITAGGAAGAIVTADVHQATRCHIPAAVSGSIVTQGVAPK